MSNVRWDRHFLQLCLDHARMSKDPSTKVGAIIVGPDREIRSFGFNGFPRGIADTPERLNDREIKYKLIVHAELNAVLNAARVGIPTKGCVLYMASIGKDATLWGGPPCVRCTVELIQAGIIEVVAHMKAYEGARWSEDVGHELSSSALLKEAGIVYREEFAA